MRKINLKAKNVANNISTHNGASGSVSLVIGIIILLIAGGLYGGVFYLKSSQDKEIRTAKTKIQTLKKHLDNNKEFKEVYDFQDRLMQLSGIEKEKVKHIDILNQLAQSTLEVDSMKNLKININNAVSTVDATLITPDLMTVAKQIDAYKNINPQGQVSLRGTSIKDGKNEMTVEFTLPRVNINKMN